MGNIIDWNNELINRGYLKNGHQWGKEFNGYHYRVRQNGNGILIDCPDYKLPNMPDEHIHYRQLDTIDDLDEFESRALNGSPLEI